jgi:hypothetical protein
MNFLRDDGPLFGEITEAMLVLLLAVIACPVIAFVVFIVAMIGVLQ